MIGETIYIVMKVTQAAIPVAWRLTEAEAEEAKTKLVIAWQQGDEGFAYFFVHPVTNS